MVAILVIFGFVFLFAYGCVKQARAVRGQRQLATAAELLLWRRVLEIAAEAETARAVSKPVNTEEDQQPHA